MSTDQPPPGSGEPPSDEDPFRKRPSNPPPPEWGGPPPDGASGGPPPGGGPYAGPGQGPPPPGGPYGGGPYGGGPGQGPPPPGGPYGEQYATDPLAGMPPLADRGRRLVARIIDALLIGIPVGGLMTLAVGGWDLTDSNDSGRSTIVEVAVLVVYFVYEGLMLSNSGQTVGKKAMRIRVAMLSDGAVPAGRPGWSRAAVYSLPQVVPCCGWLFWLFNVLSCTWDKPYRQCVHDKAAKTVVVSTA